MNKISLGKADTNDIEEIRAIAQIAFPATYSSILTQDQIDYMMEWMYSPASIRQQMAEGHIFYLAFFEGKPVGYVSIQKEPASADSASASNDKASDDNNQVVVYHLHKIYVLPDYQGYGIGKTLFNKAIDHVRDSEKSPSRIELNVNRHNKALHFYLHQGMTITRQGDFAIGNGYYMNDYILTLPIIS